MGQQLDPKLFGQTMLEELASAWRKLRQAHPNERFYSFGFYTTELAEYLTFTASTEEGLSRATELNLEHGGGDAELTRVSLRWRPCDSPLHTGESLPRSDMLRGGAPDPYEESREAEDTIALVFKTAVAALQQLDREKLFGSDIERARLVLGVWMGDQSDDERVTYARRLNPKSIVQRFARELAAGNQAFRELTRRRGDWS
jgi:hypothetical protein